MEQNLTKTSRRISKILRHDPSGLTMDAAGWVDSAELCEHLRIAMPELELIVETNDKKRFVFSEDKTRIRAAQGHSNGVAEDKEYARITAMQAETELYHGTDDVTAELIKADRILPGKRQYVHWTQSRELATKRANQRAHHNRTNPVLVVLKARSFVHGGGKLLMSENEVYLTGEVDGKTLKYEKP